jgi:two-component system sensor histidine kinase HydH
MPRLSKIFFDQSRGITPAQTAVKIALLCFLLGMLYILLSSLAVGALARTAEEVKRLELVKGVGFIFIMSFLLYLGLKRFLAHVRENEEELKNHSMALIMADKKASLGLVTATLGHDIKNLVQVLSASAEQLKLKDCSDEEYEILLENIYESSQQLRGLSERLISSARHNVPDAAEMVEIAALSRSVITILERHSSMRRIQVRNNLPAGVLIEGNRMALQQTLLNLILNAADAIESKGEILIKGYVAARENHFCLEVHDSGPGVPEVERKKIFSALYTTKSTGTGLGLLSVKACAKIHEGFVEIDDSPLGGACFRLCLPVKVVDKNGKTSEG